jgi:protein involved in polysaccharide export with SLBB domain
MRTATKRTTRSILVLALIALGAGCTPRPSNVGSDIAALAPPAAPQAAVQDYRIQPLDELHVRFTYQPDQNEQVPVRPDGRISLATTGEIMVAGMTPAEVERLVAEKSAGRLRNPEVFVIVTKVAEQRVYVAGEVNHPGYVTLQPGMSPLQAIFQTGGFRPTAKLDSVLLLTPAAGKWSAARMNMEQVVQDGVAERVRLHPGDVVFVPMTWIADMNVVVDQYVRGLIPALPHVGVGYGL